MQLDEEIYDHSECSSEIRFNDYLNWLAWVYINVVSLPLLALTILDLEVSEHHLSSKRL